GMVIESESRPLSILLVSPEFPPMSGGIGRYTYNLKKSLIEMGLTVQVVCDRRGDGEFSGIAQLNARNSEILLKLVDKIKPDVVHVQYEPGLYGLKLDTLNPAKTSTNIDSFYKFCKVPIITTFHSAYPFRQWMSLPIPIYERPQDHYLIKRAKRIISYWTRVINYRSFHRLNTQKLAQSAAGIVFSESMSRTLETKGCHVIFHGADRQDSGSGQIKSEIKKSYSIPEQGRIALALGYATATKGWDMIEKMDIPDHWTIVINPSKNGYSSEKYHIGTKKSNLINLHMDFLSEKQLSALFSCADAVILPYKVSSGSGIMFDGLSYGLPFVATQLAFFQEFALRGLGIAVKRKAEAFSKALLDLDISYDKYVKKISDFKKEITWHEVAKRHAELYRQISKRKEQTVAYPLRVGSKRDI
ncbi:MAG: glycosyltransferase family 4 protein, partial [Nitrososphaeraceae archaeon]